MHTPHTPKTNHKHQLQELYGELDHGALGNVYLAMYGQFRAEEYSHAEAITKVQDHYGIRQTDWYKARQARKLATEIER